MALNIGRKGWLGASLETSYGVPTTIADYVPFTENTLKGMSEKLNNEAAYGVRERVFASEQGRKWSEGDVAVNIDSKFVGYLLASALDDPSSSNVAGSVYDHTFTREASNTPQSLTLVNDRGGIDRQYVPGAVVKTLELSVSDGLATANANIMGKFPITVTSGTLTTASGGLFSFKDSFFAFGSTVANAAAATNLKPTSFAVTIENGTETVHRHGDADVASVNHKEFEVTAETALFFESTTNRDAYYNSTKQAACWKMTGQGIGGGYFQTLTVNFYQVRIDAQELETGLADFYAETLSILAEYDNANSKSIDVVLRNTKNDY